jgi:quercetin dioxygenase-like cupin family protein
MRLLQKITAALALVFLVAATPHKTVSKDMAVSHDQLKFVQQMPGVSKSLLWGDEAKGPHGTITRFAKGTKVDWHTHSHDIKVVVISGTLVYDNGSGEQRLGPGSFLQERSTVKHTTAAPDSDVEFYEESNGPFDLKMVK